MTSFHSTNSNSNVAHAAAAKRHPMRALLRLDWALFGKNTTDVAVVLSLLSVTLTILTGHSIDQGQVDQYWVAPQLALIGSIVFPLFACTLVGPFFPGFVSGLPGLLTAKPVTTLQISAARL